MRARGNSRRARRAKVAPQPSPEVKHTAAARVQPIEVGLPPPLFLLQEAMEEPDRRLLAEYGETIRLLRNDKRFTFREIAEWLGTHGIECDHNSVYREYTKGLSCEEERNVAQDDAEEENERV